VRTVLGALLLLAGAAHAQVYPSKPIRLVVPYPAGGVDTSARQMMAKMSEALGQPIVVENRPGANGFIGAQLVARAAPDGYTLLFPTSGTFSTGPFLVKTVPFDPVKDFTPITMAYAGMATVTVHAQVPVKSFAELVEYARKHPGKLTYASSGIGSIFHLLGEQLKQDAGLDILHVPYKGTGPAYVDLVAGRVDIGFPSIDLMRSHIKAGKVKVLAIAEAKRHSLAPELPTVAEVVPGFEKPPSWIGLFGPAGLPQPVHQRLVDTALAALNAPDVRSRLEEGGYVLIANRPDEVTAVMKRDLERAAKLVKSIGIQPE
jgi:tripartite-type tricarboxylate transporter receptor subunit TctC